ncbi:MAG: lysophospholipid acyltransferase family protein [Terriglobia bacterium]|jgi:lauroyl/myristoyl acyltransferase
METTCSTNSIVKDTKRPWITIKDIAWLLYLYPVRLMARISPFVILWFEPLTLKCSLLLSKGIQQRVGNRMKQALERIDDAHINSVVSQYLRFYLERIVDDLFLDKFARQLVSEKVSFRGMEYLQHASDQKRGVLLVSGHFFASRLAKRILAELGFPILSVRLKAPRHAGMGKLGERILQKKYMRFLHGVIQDEVYVQDKDCSLKILQRLRQGGLVNIHLDARFAAQQIPVPFLGGKRSFPVGFLRLCQIAGSPLVPFWFSGDRRQVEIEFEPPINLAETDTEEVLRSLVCRLEKRILARPEQYEWWIMLQ